MQIEKGTWTSRSGDLAWILEISPQIKQPLSTIMSKSNRRWNRILVQRIGTKGLKWTTSSIIESGEMCK